MARGNASALAMEMTKWFDTNYHFIVPELGPDQILLRLQKSKGPKVQGGQALGIDTVPVLVGPVSYLLLSKPAKGVEKSFSLLSLIGKILPIYKEVVGEPAWPVLLGFSLMSPPSPRTLNPTNYKHLQAPARARVIPYRVDSHRGNIFCFLVDGRNIRANDLAASPQDSAGALEGIVGKDKLVVSTSTSLLHTAVDLVNETKLDDEIKSWLAFAAQKVVEVNALAKALAGQKDEVPLPIFISAEVRGCPQSTEVRYSASM
ncbi:hypothetical protein IFM89_036692 [Coptis chinensis]|uniref:Cobalamin-independent methionine synthase MetE N-terminal domain-containing protein n=1 Tax=Coptis chinensis TaxID=261450 RepID=A0A835I7B1_9MAGN|nr:hypothetical protein IFM89_036692 [Coptis chinensis]